MDGEPDLAAADGGGDADVVALYGRVVGMRLSAESLRGALAAADARLEDDIKREAAAEKEADAAERRLAEKARSSMILCYQMRIDNQMTSQLFADQEDRGGDPPAGDVGEREAGEAGAGVGAEAGG